MNIETDIEQMVQRRQANNAKKAIAKWLKIQGDSSANIFKAVQWYRRLSLYKVALKLLLLKIKSIPRISSDYQLLIAEVFDSLGANHFARIYLKDVADKLTKDTDLGVAAQIFLGVGDSINAMKIYKKILEQSKDKISHFHLMSQIGYADSLCRLGKIDEAIAEINLVIEVSPFEIVHTISLSALGEYLARKGQYAKAQKKLEQALSHFSKTSKNYDFALVLKWLGYTLCKRGKRQRGYQILNRTLGTLRALGMGLDQWLDVSKMKQELGLLNRHDSLRVDILQKNIYKKQPPTEPLQQLCVKGSAEKFHIYLSSREYSLHKTKNFLGLPKELELLALIRIAEAQGISLEIIKGQLWPEEANSYLYLEQRIYLLINRLRQIYKLEINVRGGIIYLARGDWRKISVSDLSDPRPIFLRTSKVFNATDVSQFYNCKYNLRAKYLREWLKCGWSSRLKKGRYLVKAI